MRVTVKSAGFALSVILSFPVAPLECAAFVVVAASFHLADKSPEIAVVPAAVFAVTCPVIPVTVTIALVPNGSVMVVPVKFTVVPSGNTVFGMSPATGHAIVRTTFSDHVNVILSISPSPPVLQLLPFYIGFAPSIEAGAEMKSLFKGSVMRR